MTPTPYGLAADKAQRAARQARAAEGRQQGAQRPSQVQALRPARLPPASAVEEVVGGLIRAHVTACGECEAGHVFGVDERGYSQARECGCVALARQAHRLTLAQVPAGAAIPTWETLGSEIWSPQAEAATTLVEAIEDTEPGEPLPPGLLLAGPPGTGKTHTLAAIARRLAIGRIGDELARRAAKALATLQRRYSREDVTLTVPSVLFLSWPEAMGQIRSAMDGNRSAMVLDTFAAVPVLVLDELADAVGSEFEQRTLATLLVARDRAAGCTLVATNYHLGPANLEPERGRPRRPDPTALASRLPPHVISRLGRLVAVHVAGADRRQGGRQ